MEVRRAQRVTKPMQRSSMRRPSTPLQHLVRLRAIQDGSQVSNWRGGCDRANS